MSVKALEEVLAFVAGYHGPRGAIAKATGEVAAIKRAAATLAHAASTGWPDDPVGILNLTAAFQLQADIAGLHGVVDSHPQLERGDAELVLAQLRGDASGRRPTPEEAATALAAFERILRAIAPWAVPAPGSST